MSDDIQREDGLEILNHLRVALWEGRIHSSDDAIDVTERVIRTLPPSPRTAAAIRLARAVVASRDYTEVSMQAVDESDQNQAFILGVEAYEEMNDAIDAWREIDDEGDDRA